MQLVPRLWYDLHNETAEYRLQSRATLVPWDVASWTLINATPPARKPLRTLSIPTEFMPISDVGTTEMVHGNLIADAGFPLLSETIRIATELPLGSIISRDPVAGDGSLVTAATEANTFGVLRDNVFHPGELYVVYVSGAFVRDTLKTDADTSVDNVEPRLRGLGIYCRPSVPYPSTPPPTPTRPSIGSIAPNSAAAGSGPLVLTVDGGNFNHQSGRTSW
jgi:hypothetical protein